MRFPILLKDGQAAKPEDDSLYYVVASNGIFQVRNTPGYRAVTRACGDTPGLESEHERLDLLCPPLPHDLIDDVLAFFCDVYRRYGGEAIVILFYRPETREFRARAPEQTISRYRGWDGSWRVVQRLDYEHVDRPAGFLRFGSIHSHGAGPAYASHTDCADEQFEDGLHVVVGDLDRGRQSRSAAFVANGVRFDLHPDQVFAARPLPDASARDAWMERVKRIEVDRPVYSWGRGW